MNEWQVVSLVFTEDKKANFHFWLFPENSCSLYWKHSFTHMASGLLRQLAPEGGVALAKLSLWSSEDFFLVDMVLAFCRADLLLLVTPDSAVSWDISYLKVHTGLIDRSLIEGQGKCCFSFYSPPVQPLPGLVLSSEWICNYSPLEVVVKHAGFCWIQILPIKQHAWIHVSDSWALLPKSKESSKQQPNSYTAFVCCSRCGEGWKSQSIS